MCFKCQGFIITELLLGQCSQMLESVQHASLWYQGHLDKYCTTERMAEHSGFLPICVDCFHPAFRLATVLSHTITCSL